MIFIGILQVLKFDFQKVQDFGDFEHSSMQMVSIAEQAGYYSMGHFIRFLV